MTEAQAAYLKKLSERAGQPFDPSLTKYEASRRIDELRSGDGSARTPTKRAVRTTVVTPRELATSLADRMTDAQASYLKDLIEEEAGEEFDPNLSKDAASRRIAELLLRHVEHATARRER